MTITDTRTIVHDLMRSGQQRLCAAFAEIDQRAQFVAESWERPGGGGGTARVMTEGAVFERAGVNISAVYGAEVPPSIWQHRPSTRGQPYFATGISMVLHPRNPYVPAFHANFRYFEAGDDWWFGGGMDLTPSYGFAEDARHFHVTLRDYCDRHPIADYREMKATCDNYFFLKHRNEMRGIGGIFFDDLHPAGDDGFERAFAFVSDGINTILDAYLPIVRRRMNTPYGERERMWQLYRRGRYVEFNLIYDRGTLFGLQTGGNIEAILMSLPPLARWQFKYQPEPGSPEAAMAEFLKPRDWAEE
ncbi:oxygen-dependent coproporphyrinogen oxidase [Chloroflexus sp.]|uniref:oxygen-dependent coproporphyrinogen oxidase n=1 Tax=Chloroflexus sp. TaxID=1904827 RepID=UPI002ADDFC13|nr:oxygen-dependent coproporphyrinogen oxidase [Chloroflexus sp.]